MFNGSWFPNLIHADLLWICLTKSYFCSKPFSVQFRKLFKDMKERCEILHALHSLKWLGCNKLLITLSIGYHSKVMWPRKMKTSQVVKWHIFREEDQVIAFNHFIIVNRYFTLFQKLTLCFKEQPNNTFLVFNKCNVPRDLMFVVFGR